MELTTYKSFDEVTVIGSDYKQNKRSAEEDFVTSGNNKPIPLGCFYLRFGWLFQGTPWHSQA